MATSSKFWEDEEKVELLKKLWDEGLSAGRIKIHMGISRNAVIGKARRLGLASRATTQRLSSAQARVLSRRGKHVLTSTTVPKLRELHAQMKAAPAPKLAPEPLPVLDEPGGGEGVSLLDLEPHHCRYPITRELPHMFCGAGRASGSSYCQRHAAICSSRPLKPLNIHPSETVIHTQRGMAA